MRRVLASDPDNPEALAALRDICATSDRLYEAADLLDRAIEGAPVTDKPDLLLALADLVYPALKDPNRALVALRYAYELDPTRVDVVAAARRVFVAERRWIDAKQVLDDQADSVLGGSEGADADEEGEEDLESVDAEPKGKTDTIDMAGVPPDGEAGRAIQVVSELADGYLELGRTLLPHASEHALAEDCLERARALGQQGALSRLDELAHLRQSWEAAAEGLRTAGFEARDKTKAADCYLQAAELVHAYGQDPVQADDLIERCFLLVPAYAPALDFLESIHGEGRSADLARRLNAMVAAVRDPTAKVEVLLRVARLSENPPAEDDEAASNEAKGAALTAYRRVLAIRPSHRQAVQRCSALLLEGGRNDERAQVLETFLAATNDPYSQVQTHVELGRMYVEELGDAERSRAHFEAVLTRDPSNFAAASALRALYKDAGEHAAHLGVLRVLLTYAPDRGTRLEMLQQMAEVASSVGAEEAFSVLRQIYELDPDGTHERLVSAAEELQRFLPLAQSYVAAAQTYNGTRAVGMWVAAGQLFHERLPRPRDAIHAYREALRLDARNDAARSALERLLAEQDDPEALLEVLRSRLDEVDESSERTLLLARIGGVQDRDLGRLAEAIATFESVLEIDAQHQVALANLDDLHRRLEHWEELEGILVRREASAESDDDRVALMVRRARLLAGPLERSDDGAALFLELLARVPDHPEVIDGLEELVARQVKTQEIARALEPLYAQRGQYAAQVQMLARLSEVESSTDARADAAQRAADIAQKRLNDPASAFDLVAAGLRETPGNARLLDSLIRLADEAGSHDAAGDVLAALVKVEQSPEIVASLAFRLGELREGPLSDNEGAIEAYRTALDADPHHIQALVALERLLSYAEQHEELAELLRSRLASAEDDAARIQFGLSLVTLQDKHLGEPERAVETLQSLLADLPAESALLSRTAELLERLERWRELVGILERLRDASDDPDVRAAADARIADVLARHLDDPSGALERYSAALEQRGMFGPAIRGLEDMLENVEHRAAAGALLAAVYEATDDAPGLVRALQAQLASARDADERRRLFTSVADVQVERLDDAGAAFDTLTTAFQEGLLPHESLERLTELAADANRSKSLAQVYEHAVEKAPDDLDLLRALARLYDGTAGAPSRAKETWARLIERVPGDGEALEALERLTAAGDRPEALAVVLVARAEATEDVDKAASYFKRAAAVFEETAEDIPRALDVMERARELRPKDRSIWQELARYYRVLGQTERHRDALAAEAELVEAPLERARIAVALAEVRSELGDRLGAIDAYRFALDAQPDHSGARTGLESMLESADAKAAAEALEPVYRRAGDWSRLVETYETMVERAQGPTERVERLMAIRSIYEERLGRPDQAFAAAGRAFKEAPEHPDTLVALERLGRACGAVDELTSMLETRADTLPPGHPLRGELFSKLADYAEHLQGDRRRAIDILNRASADQPRATAPLFELDRLYAMGGEAREQVAVQKKLAELADTPQVRAEHLLTAATILDDRLGDRAAAAYQYEQVLQHVQGHERALDRLDALYTDSRAEIELGRILEIAAEHRVGLARAQALMRLGSLKRGALEDPRGAIRAFSEILRMDPEVVEGVRQEALSALDGLMGALKDTHPELAAQAAKLVEPHWTTQGVPAKVIAAKEARVAGTTEPTVRRRLLVEVADLYERELSKPDMAFMALARAYVLAPEDVDLVDALDRVAPVAGTEEELADLYAQAVPSIRDTDLALRLARRSALIYDQVLDRPEAAAPMYNRVLGLAEDDPAALSALERIYGRLDSQEGLLTVYRGLLRLSADDPVETDRLWLKIAEAADATDSDATYEAYHALLERRPDDITILRKMAALCERTGRWEDLWTTLDREAQVVDGDDRAQVLLRMGTFARNELRDDRRAVDAFARALQVRPEDPGAIAGLAAIVREDGPAQPMAAEALAPVYRASGAFEPYITCLEIQAASMPAGEQRRQLFIEISRVYETRLGQPERAFTWGCRALHDDLSDAEMRDRVEQLAVRADLIEDLAAFYLDEVEDLRTPDLALTLRRRVAELYDVQLGAADKAVEAYNRVLDMAPGDADALVALERLLPEVGEYGSLGDVYRRRIAQASAQDDRVQLLRQFARLQAERLGDPAGAIASLRRLLELTPDDVSALELLAALCEQENRSIELVDTLERLVGAAGADTDVGRSARVRLAQIKGVQGDLVAAERLLSAVVAEAPDHPGALEALQERFEDAVAEEDVDVAHQFGAVLADALRASEAWTDLISVLRVRASLPGGQPLDRVALNREAAQVYRDRLDQLDLAFATFGQVLADAPGLDDARLELEALAEDLGLYEPLVDALQAARDAAADSEVRLQLDRRIAQVVSERMQDPERATQRWLDVLKVAPDDLEALSALDPLFTDLGRWAGLTDVLERRIEVSDDDPDAQFELMMRLGSIWEEWLGEPDEAIRWYQRARALRTQDQGVLAALSRLVDEEKHPQAVFELLESLSAQVSDVPGRVRLWARMAKLVDERLDRPEDAIHWWSQVRRVDPGHAEAAESLERLYERTQRWTDLADLLEAQLTEAPDERSMLRLQRRLGLVRGTRLGSVDEAASAWTEILKRNPNDVEALEALRQIYRESKRWTDLVETLRKLVPLQIDPADVKAVRFELAEVFLTELDATDEAIESAKRVLDVAPHTATELKRLEEIFVATGAHGEAIKVMAARSAQAETRGQRIEILFDIARVYEEQLGRTAGAAAAYEQILQLEPTSQKAYDALAATYEGYGDYRKLGELYNRRLLVTQRADERRKLLFSIIDIQERWLGQPELAFTVACRAFGEEGADPDAQRIAERLADETENWDVLAEVYEEQVDLVPAARSAELRRRLAEVRLDRLDEPDEAERQFRMVLSVRPDDEVARARLVALFTEQQRWTDLVEQLVERVDLTGNVEQKKALLHEVAEIHEARRQDLESAVQTLRRILDLDPEDTHASTELSRVLRAQQSWEPLLHVLERRLERATTVEQQLDLRTEIAGVWAQGLKDVPRAVEAYRDVLAIEERHPPALSALEQLLTQEERWGELIENYERQVSMAESDEQAVGLLTKVATIFEERFRDLPGASRTLIRILEIDPEHRPTLSALSRVWRDGREWGSLIEALERQVELTVDPGEEVALLRQVGDVRLRHLGQVDLAEEAYNRALSIDPDDAASLHALADLHEGHGNWFLALEMLKREAAVVGASSEAVHLSYRAGKISEEMLGDVQAAKESYQKALELDPTYTPVLRALRKLLAAENRHAEVIELQAQEARYTPEPSAQADLYADAAETALREFDDVAQALRLLDRALEADAAHVPSLRTASDLLFAEERWTEAEILLDRLSDALRPEEARSELGRTYYRLAYISEKLEDDSRALERYLTAYELDATYLPTLEGLAAALMRAERWHDAQRVFHTILLQHRSALTDAEVVDLHYQIGELAVRLHQVDRAKASFDKALDLDKYHGPTLRAVAKLAEQEQAWEDAYDYRERLIDVLDGQERFEALLLQAKLCEEQIKEPYRAIDAYTEARRVRPNDTTCLSSLARLFEETSQVPRQIEVLEELAAAHDDPADKRDVLVKLAEVFLDKRDDPKAAVRVLNQALDLDPMFIDAFQRIEQILYEHPQTGRHWKRTTTG